MAGFNLKKIFPSVIFQWNLWHDELSKFQNSQTYLNYTFFSAAVTDNVCHRRLAAAQELL
jgi:hypothetical protein